MLQQCKISYTKYIKNAGTKLNEVSSKYMKYVKYMKYSS